MKIIGTVVGLAVSAFEGVANKLKRSRFYHDDELPPQAPPPSEVRPFGGPTSTGSNPNFPPV